MRRAGRTDGRAPGAWRFPGFARVLGVLALGALLVCASSVEAQSVFGHDAGRRRVMTGVWALHPFEPQFPEVEWAHGWGLAWGQWLGGTFTNSYDERAFMLGLERSWGTVRRGFLEAGVGYRAGLVTGYDERLVAWAEHAPVLPFAGLHLWSDVGPLGVDAFYVYRAITLEASVRF